MLIEIGEGEKEMMEIQKKTGKICCKKFPKVMQYN